MPRYEVDIVLEGTVQVEAASPEEAREQVESDWSMGQVVDALQRYHHSWSADNARPLPDSLRQP